jgi:hypothetical protein
VVNHDEIVAAIKTYCMAESERDRTAWLGLFAEDIVHEDPVGISTNRGLEALSKFWDRILASNVDLRLLEDVIVCGKEAVAIMGCETGPAEARRKTAPIVDLFVFNDAGKITNVRAFYKYA